MDEDGRAIGEAGLTGAIARFEAAIADGTPDPAIPLGEALGWIYALEEWHRRRLQDDRRDYYAIRSEIADGEVTAALIFARNVIAHELTRVSELIRLGGLPAPLPMAFGDAGEQWIWTPRMKIGDEDRRGRHLLYEKYLQGRAVGRPFVDGGSAILQASCRRDVMVPPGEGVLTTRP